MANNLTLQVMANLAARGGYQRPEEIPCSNVNVAPVHLDRYEEEMLLRAIGRGEKSVPSKQSGPKAAAGVLSLDELAAQKR